MGQMRERVIVWVALETEPCPVSIKRGFVITPEIPRMCRAGEQGQGRDEGRVDLETAMVLHMLWR